VRPPRFAFGDVVHGGGEKRRGGEYREAEFLEGEYDL
jgi:hypothetical protein